ncbi:MAG: HDOD domain-containing protein [Sedimentisphaerales bacterium]|nr:HDOD domain-containing protein [Sedimentisphaerales bacterium]
MTQSAINTSAQTARLSVYQLDHLAAHPLCAAKCAEYLSQEGSYDNVSSLLSSDPALGLAVINLCREKNITVDLENFDFSSLLEHFRRSELLKAILGLKVYDIENAPILSFISTLIHRSSTRAFAARLIAQKIESPNISQAFAAGLFADAGKFAIAQLYTKSMLILLEESKQKDIPVENLEREHLGITDNIASRTLMEKWQFGTSISEAVWLYQSPMNGLIDKLPNSDIIMIVQLAEALSNPDNKKDTQNLFERLSVTEADINDINEQIRAFSRRSDKLLGLEVENPQQTYFETTKRIYLNQLNARPSEDKFTEFAQKFIGAMSPQANLINILETAAKVIADCFVVQDICVFTPDPEQPKVLLSSVIKGCSARLQAVSCPQYFSLSQITKGHLQPWLFKQVGIDSDKSYFVPIENGSKTVGGIILAGVMPDKELLEKITAFLGRFFAICGKSEYEISIVELAVNCLSEAGVSKSEPAVMPELLPLREPVKKPETKSDIIQTAGELAAGIAHELNNPLAIISGRAQLLEQSETDETRKLVLNQILEKTGSIGEIVGELMSYARPPKPQIRGVSPFIVINNSLEKVRERYLSEPLEITLENIENLSDVKVDAEQVAESIAQIIYNALESYESGNGPVQIIGSEKTEEGTVEISIKDKGCGMNEETLRKATEPFFSDKSAGRQRGMGLSMAEAFLRNNRASLDIQSQIDKGTTVKVTLPVV